MHGTAPGLLDEDRALTRSSRRRGQEIAVPEDLTRLVSLSDGVFAFAMTLLVLNLVVPVTTTTQAGLWAYLRAQLVGTQNNGLGPFELYALGFVIIAVWWRLHVRVFRRVRAADTTILWLDVAYLLFIGITPFSLSLIIRFGGYPAADSFYSATQAMIGLMGAGIRFHCSRRPELCKGPPPKGRQVYSLFMSPVIFGLATVASLVTPLAAEALWLVAVLLGPAIRRMDAAEPPVLESGEVE